MHHSTDIRRCQARKRTKQLTRTQSDAPDAAGSTTPARANKQAGSQSADPRGRECGTPRASFNTSHSALKSSMKKKARKLEKASFTPSPGGSPVVSSARKQVNFASEDSLVQQMSAVDQHRTCSFLGTEARGETRSTRNSLDDSKRDDLDVTQLGSRNFSAAGAVGRRSVSGLQRKRGNWEAKSTNCGLGRNTANREKKDADVAPAASPNHPLTRTRYDAEQQRKLFFPSLVEKKPNRDEKYGGSSSSQKKKPHRDEKYGGSSSSSAPLPPSLPHSMLSSPDLCGDDVGGPVVNLKNAGSLLSRGGKPREGAGGSSENADISLECCGDDTAADAADVSIDTAEISDELIKTENDLLEFFAKKGGSRNRTCGTAYSQQSSQDSVLGASSCLNLEGASARDEV